MGYGRWSSTSYNTLSATRAATGASAFAYTDDTLSRRPRNTWKPHQTLDPSGLTARESRDSVDHPNSLAVMFMLDITGSMASIPRTLQKELPALLTNLQDKNGLDDVQILFGAIGDTDAGDPIPLQVGQFESDNRLDENLENLALVGGGGSGMHESYELAFYVAAKHTSIDCFEKRGEKGFLFITGDEMARKVVKATDVLNIFGFGIQEDIPFQEVLDETKAKFNTFFILPTRATHGRDQRVIDFWTNAVGPDNFLTVQDESDIVSVVSEAIARTQAASLLPSTTTP
jgi:hypothetical protein